MQVFVSLDLIISCVVRPSLFWLCAKKKIEVIAEEPPQNARQTHLYCCGEISHLVRNCCVLYHQRMALTIIAREK